VICLYNPHDPKSVEKYSAAVTLSDMEVFIFPELLYALVLANIMSPLLWKWRDDPWFQNLHKLSPYRKILRTKQFIMDRFCFNLDLETWGLTTKERELARFADFIDERVLARSNALFGYEGDKYYFDIDIRKHFGLDKYDSNVIPYWKTETLEAMVAFKYKESYRTGAGECVSLAALYASALFVIAGVPLEKIYLMATPLHSQNFVDINDGIITNNRRLVTKKMWFNGTELSAKARRALQHEQVTFVINNTGYVHVLYPEATMPPDVYRHFSDKLRKYLVTDINYEIIANFLRHHHDLQKCFQIMVERHGKTLYLEAEKAYHYEHNSKARMGDVTQQALLAEIDEDEFYPSPIPRRLILNEFEALFQKGDLTIDELCQAGELQALFAGECYDLREVLSRLAEFCKIEPRLPSPQKQWQESTPIALDPGMSRQEIIDYLRAARQYNATADLAFMAYRDLTQAPWEPFLKAALERNPVSREGAQGLTIGETVQRLARMGDQSIYSGTRLAQPDEVWNFGTGDGVEKAICLMNIIKERFPAEEMCLESDGQTVCLRRGNGKEYFFRSNKRLAFRLPVR